MCQDVLSLAVSIWPCFLLKVGPTSKYSIGYQIVDYHSVFSELSLTHSRRIQVFLVCRRKVVSIGCRCSPSEKRTDRIVVALVNGRRALTKSSMVTAAATGDIHITCAVDQASVTYNSSWCICVPSSKVTTTTYALLTKLSKLSAS